jgi:hypothetical protein
VKFQNLCPSRQKIKATNPRFHPSSKRDSKRTTSRQRGAAEQKQEEKAAPTHPKYGPSRWELLKFSYRRLLLFCLNLPQLSYLIKDRPFLDVVNLQVNLVQ